MAITVENERLCPSVIADEVHLPSPTVPFSIPVVVYVTKSRLGIESDGTLPPGWAINYSGSHIETVEIEVHDRFCQPVRDFAISKSVAGSIPP